MADDTRDSSSIPPDDQAEPKPRGPRRPDYKHEFPRSQAQKMWEALGNPQEPVNTLPGGTYNSAGGKPSELSWRDAFNFSYEGKGPAFYRTPCARDSLLVGIASGGAIGGLRFVLKGLSGGLVTANFMVAGFTVTACGMYYWCDERRKQEAKGIAAAVAGMKYLQEKRAREKEEEAAQAAEAAKVEEERKRNRQWYKFW
ncbi:uncharacterized protein Z518_08152 [Rhinocladiella mackenziei CBS 650.93]|uniref:Cytochrome c oxidase assembly protein COX20, mitochondrial n=1 Tax=Rhinocladiella mackenziei CBS 650.93 TaxID=1442369 RepID=A0A0D2GVA0_9EURO|nr:uncharacterized protein Z518_08152 [Rhinocladiella mackenziei CBS 650.93]KIX02213.1 hypothetical protein Z518_08152 [Rhinocladiella mackenziei CBS 650.93]